MSRASDVIERWNKLKSAAQLIDGYQEELRAQVEHDLRRGRLKLLDLALQDKIRACDIAHQTIVTTSLKDAKNRVEGLLEDYQRKHMGA